MSNITVMCDRCHKTIEGLYSEPDDSNHLGYTAGYYSIKEDGKGWGKYTDPDERIVCDQCMWADPRYIADYGINPTSEVQA